MNLIYIISTPRSGSTMLQRLIGTNEKFATLPETWYLLGTNIFSANNHGSLETGFYVNKNALNAFQENTNLNENFFFNLSLKNYRSIISSTFSNHNYFVEKTPRNVLILKHIYECLDENDKIIILTRNLKDTMHSYLTYFDKIPYLKSFKFFKEIQKYNQILQSFIKSNSNDSKILVLRYEELVESSESVKIKLEKFLEHKFYFNSLKVFDSLKSEKFYGDKKNLSMTEIIETKTKTKTLANLVSKYYFGKQSVLYNIAVYPLILMSIITYRFNPRIFKLLLKNETFTH